MSWFVSNEAEFFALSLSVCRIKFFEWEVSNVDCTQAHCVISVFELLPWIWMAGHVEFSLDWFPHVRTFMEFDLDKLIVQLSGFNEAKSRSKETWFRRIIERFSRRVDQSVAFTKPSSLYFFWQQRDESRGNNLEPPPENKNNTSNAIWMLEFICCITYGVTERSFTYYPLTKSLGPRAVMLHSRISTVVHAEAVCAQKIHLIDYF